MPALLPHIQAGTLRALAVSSPHRIASLPDVPTVAESGVPGTRGFEADQWYGLFAPAGTPAAIVATLNRQVHRSPDSAGQLIAREIKRWKHVIEAAHITVD